MNATKILLIQAAAGAGDVTGPASATDNAICRFDGTGGKTIQNSAVTIADTTGAMTFSNTGSFISIAGTTASTSTTTGSLINAGGFGNAGNAYIGGNLNVKNSAGSTFIQIDRTANTNYGTIQLLTNGTADWVFGNRETTDSNFHIFSYGTVADVLTIARATGNVTMTGNLTLTAATSTITLGSTNTGSIAVDANGALTVTPKSGQPLTVASNLNFNGILIGADTTTAVSYVALNSTTGGAAYLARENSAGTGFAGTAYSLQLYTDSKPIILAPGGVNKFQIDPTTGLVTMAGNLTVSGTGTHTFGTTNTVTMTAGVISAVGVGCTIASGTAIPAGGTAGTGYKFSSTSNFGVFFGSGAPTLSAARGSLYLRSDGSGTTDRVYINTNGSTTWTAVTTVA